MKTGFFEESPGVRSMARLAIFWLLTLVTPVVGATCFYIFRGSPDAKVLAACAAILGALVLNGAVAIIKRNGGSDAQ